MKHSRRPQTIIARVATRWAAGSARIHRRRDGGRIGEGMQDCLGRTNRMPLYERAVAAALRLHADLPEYAAELGQEASRSARRRTGRPPLRS